MKKVIAAVLLGIGAASMAFADDMMDQQTNNDGNPAANTSAPTDVMNSPGQPSSPGMEKNDNAAGGETNNMGNEGGAAEGTAGAAGEAQ